MRQNAHAVIIGIDKYQDSRIRDLRLAVNDARTINRVLTNPVLGGIPQKNVIMLLDENATQRRIQSSIGTQLRRQAAEEDLVIVFFAGHGAVEQDPRSKYIDGLGKYLVPHDAEADNLYTTAISMVGLREYFDRVEVRQMVFLLDSCYSGHAAGRSFSNPNFTHRAMLTEEFLDNFTENGEGRIIITACGVKESAIELHDMDNGLFTHYLAKGLSGEADSEKNGRVTVDDLYNYVKKRVNNHAREVGVTMRPVRKGSIEGEIVLSYYNVRDSDPTLTPVLTVDVIDTAKTKEREVAADSGDGNTDLILVPGGSFVLGQTPDKEDNLQMPREHLLIKPFFLGKYAVTFAEYDAFCTASNRERPGDEGWGRARRPVINVDVFDVAEYCNWRSLNEGLAPCYLIEKDASTTSESGGLPWSSDTRKSWQIHWERNADGYRLPTEAEWEYAAREAGAVVRFGNGKQVADPDEINFNAMQLHQTLHSQPGVYREMTVETGTFATNSLGLYEMSGNVWEWCWPLRFSGEAEPESREFALRGGSWYHDPKSIRTTARIAGWPDSRNYFIGFRYARNIAF